MPAAPMTADARQLLELLSQESVSPDLLESGLPGFGDEAKREVAIAVADMEAPPARLIARLQFIRTAGSEDEIVRALTRNAGSSDPSARKFSLYGLAAIGHPDAPEIARARLNDDDEQVVVAAAQVALAGAAHDPALAAALRELYARNEGNPGFEAAAGLMRAAMPDLERPA